MTTEITDEYMRTTLSQTKSYTVMILHKTHKYYEMDVQKIIWEHGRRNFQLRADGILPIVIAIQDDSDVSGIGIFNTSPEEVSKIYDDDPAVKAGVFTFEVHSGRSFPGGSLP